jgi:hypothetical protein
MMFNSAALLVAGSLSSYFAAAPISRAPPEKIAPRLLRGLKTFLLTFGVAPLSDIGPPRDGMNADLRLDGQHLT